MARKTVGKTVLYIVVPCYNEEKVLPVTSGLFLDELKHLTEAGKISDRSRVLFVNDGSTDRTWEIISALAARDRHFIGISQSRNRGHQNAVFAGLMEAKDRCDAAISIDADGQDDISAMEEMIDRYHEGCEIVYGVRNSRKTDTFFKRFTAESYYKLLKKLGAKDIINNHADYRLMSSRALQEFAKFKEVNLFLRGMVPMVGFKSGIVYYERKERIAGESHYPLSKMLSLAFEGITSLSGAPMQIIMTAGAVISAVCLVGVICVLIAAVSGHPFSGWVNMTWILCLLGGILLFSLGVVGVYINKIYLETKSRPRYIISERTWQDDSRESSGQNFIADKWRL